MLQCPSRRGRFMGTGQEEDTLQTTGEQLQRDLWVARRHSKYHQGLLRFSEYPRCEPAMCPAHVILYADKGDAFHLPLIFSPSKILSKSGTERTRIRLGWGRGEGMLQKGWAGEKARRTKCISLRGTSSWLALFSSD